MSLVSDNMSWTDFNGALRTTAMADEWERFRSRNKNAKLVLVDVHPNASTQVHERADVLNVGGFSDAVFDVVSLFSKGEADADHWVGAINSVSLA